MVQYCTDYFPDETSWYLKNSTGDIVAAMDTFVEREKKHPIDVDLCSGESYTSILLDSFRDGQTFCSHYELPPFFEVKFEDTVIFEVTDNWSGSVIESDPIVLSSS